MANASCDTACATHGGANAATITYAGASIANCTAVGQAFEPLFTANLAQYIYDPATSTNGPAGVGCMLMVVPLLASHFVPAQGIPLLLVSAPVTTAAAAAGRSRFCACNN